MALKSITVNAFWDPQAHVWVASSLEVAELVAEAATLEQLQAKTLAMLEDLIELNGIDTDLPEITVHFKAEHSAKLAIPRAA